MARLCPHLESLRLLYCGQMQTDTLKDWAESMRDLRELELYAPFLVRQEGWEAFFRARGSQLEKFLLTQSPRFDEDTLDVLVSSAPNLKALRLSEIGKLNSEWLPTIAKLKNLEYLDLSSPGTPLSDDAVAELLSAVGGKLTKLDLSSNPELSDEVLDAIAKYCPRLTHLSLHHVDLSDEGLVRFFRALKAKKRPGLIELDLEKGHDLQSLDDLIAHSGQTLKTLSLCGWRGAEREQLSRLGECKNLEFLDISWCRNTNDFTVKDILDGCDAIKEVRVWGEFDVPSQETDNEQAATFSPTTYRGKRVCASLVSRRTPSDYTPPELFVHHAYVYTTQWNLVYFTPKISFRSSKRAFFFAAASALVPLFSNACCQLRIESRAYLGHKCVLALLCGLARCTQV